MVARKTAPVHARKKPHRLLADGGEVKQPLTPQQVVAAIRVFAANIALSRSSLARSQEAVGLDPPNRDLDAECGYPTCPGPEVYRYLHRRNGVARRVNDFWADECFAVYPEVYETEDKTNTNFEKAWRDLDTRHQLLHHLHRIDRLSGIGRFGVLLLGLSDKRKLAEPVYGLDGKTGERTGRGPQKALKLTYLVPFAENFAKVHTKDEDEASERFGQPVLYELSMSDPSTPVGSSKERKVLVHWTRVLHVADNRDESNLAGTPRMEPVLNYLLDLRKIGGSSAEMLYKGGFPGFSFETVPELAGESVMDEESVREQLIDYMNGLQRYLALDGVTAKPLLPQAVDPTAHAHLQLEFICLALGVPLRIFMGSEASHQASSQDTGNWNKRVAKRQMLYVEPMLIRPFVDRLIMLGVLPAPVRGSYTVSWKDLNTVTDKDKAAISLQRAQALMQYVTGGCEAVVPVREFLTLVMNFTPAEADAIEKSLATSKPKTDPLGIEADARATKQAVKVAKATPRARPQGGGRVGNAPRATPGRPAARTPAA